MGIIKGKKLLLFVKQGETYKSIGYSTNHSFSSSASTIDVSHKDTADAGLGRWDDQDVDVLSWSITSESLYANEANGYTPEDIFALYANGQPIEVKFGLAAESASGAPVGGWTPSGEGLVLSGKAVITSFEINASNGDNATMSITLTGKGPVVAE